MTQIKTGVAPKKATEAPKKSAVIKQLAKNKKQDPLTVVVNRDEVIGKGTTGKGLAKQIEKNKRLKDALVTEEVPATPLPASTEVAPELVVESDDEKFEREYNALLNQEASGSTGSGTAAEAGDAIIKDAITPKEETKGKRKRSTTGTKEEGDLHWKTAAAEGKLKLPEGNYEGQTFSEADFFRIKHIVETLAKKPNLLYYLSQNM